LSNATPNPDKIILLYGYVIDIFRSPLWLCASHSERDILVHRTKGTKVDFARTVADERIRMIDGIDFFDAHQLVPKLLNVPALQFDPHGQPVMGPAGAGDEVVEPNSEGEASSVEANCNSYIDPDDGEPWYPPQPGVRKSNRRGIHRSFCKI